MGAIYYDYTVIEATPTRASRVVAVAMDQRGAEVARSGKWHLRSDAIAELRRVLLDRAKQTNTVGA